MLDVRDVHGNRIGGKRQLARFAAGDIEATGIAPSDQREAAILYPEIAPGLYTVLLSGKDSSVGVGSVEIYNVP